jgi:ethanolamine utilization microcompartment shell protein EutS
MGLNGYRVQVPANADEQKILRQLHKLDPKSIATLNHIYVPARGVMTTPSDRTVGAGSLAAKRTNARIGLVDAHVDSKHPLLKSVRVASRVFGVANAAEDNHGTAVASRIAEAAPGANLYVASVFSEMSSGNEIASVYAIAKGLEWLSVNKVPVINLSLTGPSNPILKEITSRLTAQGFLLVAAVGNEGPHAPAQYPAAYDGVIGVTAVDDQEHVYLYANQGSYVDFAAPGVNTVVASGSGKTETASGTSFAAPVIAVALARLLPRPDKALATKAEAELEKQAKDLGAPGRDSVFGYGVIEPTPVD